MASVWGNEKGFTMVELLIVVMIIVALAILAIPKFMKEAGRQNKLTAQETLKTIHQLEQNYFQVHKAYIGADDTEALAASDLGFKNPGPNSPYEYLVRNVTDTAFTAVARERNDADGDGTFGESLSIDQDGAKKGDWK